MNQRKSQNLRQAVAVEAARIIAAGGQRNYLSAKQKAASRLGISNSASLPSNREVEEALKTHLALYDTNRQETLNKLRQSALEAMQFLQDFHPRLVGPVLEGTADQHSRISLHLFSDPVDKVALHLLDRNLPFRQDTRRIRWHDGEHREVPLILMEVDGQTVELSLFRLIDRRQAPPDPINGKPQRRASAAEVKTLLEAEEPELVIPAVRT